MLPAMRKLYCEEGVSQMKRIRTPLDDETIRTLKAGDQVVLSGVILTGRDAAHKRLVEAYKAGQELPVDLRARSSVSGLVRPNREGD